ncbi:T9SS type A sorting domain-containing protein [Flavobacteriales bacterium]|jgi:hypothetical protein|nr:T9SS type A sorting domain-containing protein [Flavobacteriales bacterium]MDB4195448.1 T9SS type A sorting domain-containing protein [Flavobacteriales bacterium]
MKKLLFPLAFFFTTIGYSQSCVADATALNAYIAPSTWGVMPDTIDNLPPAFINVQYDTFLSFKLPMFANELDPTLPAIQLDNLKLLNITGLPAGITFTSGTSTTDSVYCNTANCTWNAGTVGCVRFIGTPTVTGVFPLIITLEGTTIGGPLAQTGTGDINGYKLNIAFLSIEKNTANNVELQQNSPNPFANFTKISFSSSQASEGKFYVMNLLGEIVYESTINSRQGLNTINFDGTDLKKGMYLYSIEIDGVKMTKRMVIQK